MHPRAVSPTSAARRLERPSRCSAGSGSSFAGPRPPLRRSQRTDAIHLRAEFPPHPPALPWSGPTFLFRPMSIGSGKGDRPTVTVHGDCPDFRGQVRENGAVPLGRSGRRIFRLEMARKTRQSPACERLRPTTVPQSNIGHVSRRVKSPFDFLPTHARNNPHSRNRARPKCRRRMSVAVERELRRGGRQAREDHQDGGFARHQAAPRILRASQPEGSPPATPSGTAKATQRVWQGVAPPQGAKAAADAAGRCHKAACRRCPRGVSAR